MELNKDTITTIAGAVGAIAEGTQPIVNAVQGSFSRTDVARLIVAAVLGLVSWYIGKPNPPVKVTPTVP